MIIAILIVLGLSFGSFIGAFHWRLHTGKNFVSDRSICEHCKHELAWYDLLPVISWLQLQGKCRYCQKAIGYLPPALELATAAIFVASYLLWPYTLVTISEIAFFGIWLTLLVGLITLFVYDIRWQLLPDKVVFPLIGIALVFRLIEALIYDIPLVSVVGSILFGVLIGGGFFWALHTVSKGRWIGGGDITLGALIGVLLGPFNAFIALMIGFYSATIFVLPLLVLKRINRKSKVPFGPFLIAGLVATFLLNDQIRQLYNLYFGL